MQINAVFVLKAELVIDFGFTFGYARKKLCKWILK